MAKARTKEKPDIIKIPAKQNGAMRKIKNPNNVGDIAIGTTTPPKVMYCGIIMDGEDNFIAHVHAGMDDVKHFIRLRGDANGNCRLCSEGVPVIDPPLYHVVNKEIRLKGPYSGYVAQLHPE